MDIPERNPTFEAVSYSALLLALKTESSSNGLVNGPTNLDRPAHADGTRNRSRHGQQRLHFDSFRKVAGILATQRAGLGAGSRHDHARSASAVAFVDHGPNSADFHALEFRFLRSRPDS